MCDDRVAKPGAGVPVRRASWRRPQKARLRAQRERRAFAKTRTRRGPISRGKPPGIQRRNRVPTA
jgi:hypothetical protein